MLPGADTSQSIKISFPSTHLPVFISITHLHISPNHLSTYSFHTHTFEIPPHHHHETFHLEKSVRKPLSRFTMAKKWWPNRSQKAKANGQPENQPAAASGAQAQEENPLQQRSENITTESGRPPRRNRKRQHQKKASGPNPDIVPPSNQGNQPSRPQPNSPRRNPQDPHQGNQQNRPQANHQNPNQGNRTNLPRQGRNQAWKIKTPAPLPTPNDQPPSSHQADQAYLQPPRASNMSRRGRIQWGRRGNGPQRNENSFGPGPIAARKPQSDGKLTHTKPTLSMGSMLTQSEIEIYGIVQSTQRLEKFGFRPEVTLLSTSEYYKAWEKMAMARSSKPSRADLYDVADGIQGALGLRSRESTLVNNQPVFSSSSVSLWYRN